jgi:hypothetical protein
MSKTSINIHDCKCIRVDVHGPSNSNHITIHVDHHDGDVLELTMFDLPSEITRTLMVAFSDSKTAVRGDADCSPPAGLVSV